MPTVAEKLDSSRLSVVVVVGPTGVGKSKLSVDLARRLGGECVNADALQVYAGLDVTTNKATSEEKAGVPHHLMGFLPPDAVEFTALKFRDLAVPVIAEIASRGKLPIIVGGSNYYVQALVSEYLRDERSSSGAAVQRRREDIAGQSGGAVAMEDDGSGSDGDDVSETVHPASYLHNQLRAVDEAAAARIHPNDHRKIAKYLEICRQTGQRPSDLFRSQSRRSQLRYHCCWLWLDAEGHALESHLSARVRDMLRRGLLEEVGDILSQDHGGFSAGLTQAIGALAASLTAPTCIRKPPPPPSFLSLQHQ
mmetsp:Transcript_35723/g.63702  ORF Transcript_35723/g.63702 Transcript_35723/m.63702 type:complete len:308 (-) Transcript_35723:1555-2478(-)